MLITETDHIREIVASCNAKPLPIGVSEQFEARLGSYPFAHSRIDWAGLSKYSSFEWGERSDEDAVAWARTLRIGKYEHVALWFSSHEPCLLMRFDYGVANLDLLTWNAPGTRYLFGVDVKDGQNTYAYDALIETTGGPLLHGVV